MKMSSDKGFTLLEMLVALFIFTIVSLILTSVLHSVITIQSSTSRHAERLHRLQLTLLKMSRDIGQIVDRPVMNAAGKEEGAFVGGARRFTFTQVSGSGLSDVGASPALTRTSYVWTPDALKRVTWEAVDQAPRTSSHGRILLEAVKEAHFEYLDKKGRFYQHWPLNEDKNEGLPRAVRIHLTISQWGEVSQLYVIPADSLSSRA